MTETIYDPITEQTVRFPFEPLPPVRGLAEGQTYGCYCPRCADPDDDRPCLHAGRDLPCYCPGCADPERSDKCRKHGAPTCGRCGRRDWAMLSCHPDPPICGRCRWVLYTEARQTGIDAWAGGPA